jgi:hypothetical protein
MELSKIYKIFTSEDGDWNVASKIEDGNVSVLHEGHDRERCYKAILDDLGFDIKILHVIMKSGSYTPTIWDFE